MTKMTLIAILVLTLSACDTVVPVHRTFPDMPPVLKEECAELVKLEKIDKSKPFSVIDLLGTNIENYRRGVECKVKHSATIEWHDEQRRIFNSVK